jgi:hypothetical protein
MTLAHVTDHEARGAARLTEQFKHQVALVALLKSWLGEVQQLEDQAYELRLQRALETAEGVNLDVLGAIVGQPREGRTDTQYRVWIAGRALVNRSRGKTPQMIAIAAKLVGGAVELREYQPATMVIYAHVPVLGSSGVEIAKLLKLAKAGGIKMHFVWYDVVTAFRFSPTGESVFDSERGFGAGRMAAVSDGSDMAFDLPTDPDLFGGFYLVVL